ncbi:MAG: Crp/Fnr family transcriptional regulator [Acidobacteriota bacterium]|nr:Crp/Fnr family transcriptional regulator [Acidobacteriota bacterium]
MWCGDEEYVAAEQINLSEVLQRSALLANLSPAEIKLLAERTVRKHVSAGENLFHEGEACQALHIIARGRVRIYKVSASGREQVLAINGPGECVAELPVFDGGNYPASAVALEDGEIAYILRRDFLNVCLERPEVALKMLAMVGARLRRLVGIIEELSFTTIRQRLVAALLRMAQCSGRHTERGIELTLPGSHQELANELGTVRELISRNLMRLQAEGFLEVDARHVVIKDEKGLGEVLLGS